MELDGVIPPMLTPTTSQMEVDTTALREFTAFLVDGGVHGLFPAGTTGEFSSLTLQQRRTVVRTVAEESGDVPVLAGCGGTSVRAVEEQIQGAADGGADAAVVVTPYYFSTTQGGLEHFYQQVATDAPLPIYLYNIPQLTGSALERTTVARLAEHPNVVGIKDSSGDFLFFMSLLEGTPPSFNVLQGISTYAISSLEMGADGLVTGPANVFPRLTSELYEAHEFGDYVGARERLSDVVLPILRNIQSLPTVPALKYLSALAGRDLGEPLPPLPTLNAEQRNRLEACHRTVVETGLVPEER